ncbi:LacI family DNA-binding transcriptional regulator [Cellulosimicrobium protaetiae]|uniref:LacI family DNA-binding transcriptional regulator n=1 Tax=Cellulosimicrobium protaetiae TaxID=2587808 RepID=A0A6M5UDD1_9MICO|nr:LacI family DNA-binding transcriptional regulator [Cellulosimicrobium protaetiae]QJW36210.1 LacI family DNA-binding transcriptional regulator [Cellulosimicrobium protaetiae]
MARITIADIARRAGVSTGAVSYALNNRPGVSAETRSRILGVAAELGWEPSSAARSLSGARTETVGLVLARDPSTLGFESFYMQFIAGIESELAARSYGLLLQVVPDLDAELRAYRKWRAARRVDGVVTVDLRLDDPRVAWLSEPDAIPAVVVGDPALAGNLTNVWTDDASAMRESVRYLHTVGHRRIARVAGVTSFGHTHIRDEAFRAETARLDVQGQIARTDYTADQGASATRTLLTGTERPSAIIYDNDVMALAGLGVASELGVRVPADLSIVAWDDSPLCQATYPRLSALSHDVTSFGAHVARRLFDRIDGRTGGSFLDSTPTLRPRGTTARHAEG